MAACRTLGNEPSLSGSYGWLRSAKPLRLRRSVRPGLTGRAQVCGGRLISVDEKGAPDEWYIRHASLWLGANIALRSIWMVPFTGDRRDDNAIARAVRDIAQSEPVGLPQSIGPKAETKNEPSGPINRVEAVSS